MDIDVAMLRALEREKDIPLDVLVDAIEAALLGAYLRTDGAHRAARAELDRKTGHVVIWAREETHVELTPDEVEAIRAQRGEDDERQLPTTRKVLGEEFDDTPSDFGRVAAATARQVIAQRMRDIEDEAILGDFKGREGDIVAGVIQQSPNPRHVTVDFGTVEGILPLAEQVPGETYEHGTRIRCYVVSVKRGLRGPEITLSRTHPNLVKKLFELEVPEIADGSVQIAALARESGHRTKIAVRSKVPGLNAKGACIGPMGQRVRAVMAQLGGEKIDIVDHSDIPQEFIAHASRNEILGDLGLTAQDLARSITATVSVGTIDWHSVHPRTLKLMPVSETIVMAVTIIATLATSNLAIGVVLGVVTAMIMFARRVAHIVSIEKVSEIDGDGDGEIDTRTYRVHGQLFWASSNDLVYRFDYTDSARHITIDLTEAEIWDASTVATFDAITQKFQDRGKTVSIIGLDGPSQDRLNRLSGRLGTGH